MAWKNIRIIKSEFIYNKLLFYRSVIGELIYDWIYQIICKYVKGNWFMIEFLKKLQIGKLIYMIEFMNLFTNGLNWFTIES